MAILSSTQLNIIARTVMPELYRLQAHEDSKKELRADGVEEGTIVWLDAIYWLTRRSGEMKDYSTGNYEQ